MRSCSSWKSPPRQGPTALGHGRRGRAGGCPVSHRPRGESASAPLHRGVQQRRGHNRSSSPRGHCTHSADFINRNAGSPASQVPPAPAAPRSVLSHHPSRSAARGLSLRLRTATAPRAEPGLPLLPPTRAAPGPRGPARRGGPGGESSRPSPLAGESESSTRVGMGPCAVPRNPALCDPQKLTWVGPELTGFGAGPSVPQEKPPGGCAGGTGF